MENFAAGAMAAKFTNLEGKDYVDPEIITEDIEHSWYSYPQAGKALHPFAGVTAPNYTGPKEGTKTNWKYLDEKGKYSWIKTPLWRGKMAEVGPLARYIVTYVKVKQGLMQPTWAEKMIVDQIDGVSKVLGAPAHVWMCSTVGRTACRGLEAQVMAYINKYFFDKMIKNIRNGDTATANMSKFEPASWPKEAKGVGLHEAPRGALGHWIQIKNGLTANYQAVVPSTWNACPRDSKAGSGAYESSMIETKIKVADKPLEVLRVIHSFDPCIACATHLYDTEGNKKAVIHSDPYINACGGCGS